MEVKVIRSARKSASIEIDRDLSVTVRVPLGFSDGRVERFLRKNSEWISEHMECQRRRNAALALPIETPPAVLREKAAQVLPPLVEKYSDMTGLTPRGFHVNSAKKRLGSCSPDNSLNFSYNLMLYDESVIEYVVLHEIVHIKEHNHGRRFYALIESYMPDWRERVALIRG